MPLIHEIDYGTPEPGELVVVEGAHVKTVHLGADAGVQRFDIHGGTSDAFV